MSTGYLETTRNVYKEAAENPQAGLCCTTTSVWQLPGLDIPKKMQEMNYGCGSTVHPRDLVNNPNILYWVLAAAWNCCNSPTLAARKTASWA